MCCECVFTNTQCPHEPPAFDGGGGGRRGMDHASTQIPLQFKLSTWSNGITALRDS